TTSRLFCPPAPTSTLPLASQHEAVSLIQTELLLELTPPIGPYVQTTVAPLLTIIWLAEPLPPIARKPELDQTVEAPLATTTPREPAALPRTVWLAPSIAITFVPRGIVQVAVWLDTLPMTKLVFCVTTEPWSVVRFPKLKLNAELVKAGP